MSKSIYTMLGDYPITAALKQGRVRSPDIAFEFADVKVPNTAFRRVVSGEFEIAELAIVTFLMAKAHGRPLVLIPATVLGRFQQQFLVYNGARGTLAPRDLEGKRVGIRSYSVTTVTWLRGILASDYGVDLDRIRWVTFEDAHVSEFKDPPGVERAAAGKDLTRMLEAGELDAAIIGGAIAEGSPLRTLIPDPQAAAKAWHAKNRATQINHMVVARAGTDAAALTAFYRMLKTSKEMAGLPRAGELDVNPFGVANNRRNLEIAIDYVFTQKLIPRRFSVDELFDDVTREFD